MDDTEIIDEFLIETSENMARLDLDLVELERRPKYAGLLASIFRTIHTIKGTCGLLDSSETTLNLDTSFKRIVTGAASFYEAPQRTA